MNAASGDRWYAAWCKPGSEGVAEANLARQGFKVYLPRVLVRRRRRQAWAEVVEALFPRYLFVRVDPAARSTAPIRSTRGVVGLLRFGAEAAVVPDAVIDEILRHEDSAAGMRVTPTRSLHTGDAVRVTGGALCGVEAVYAQQDGDSRVFVLIELLGKLNRLSINRHWIEPAA